MQYTAADASWLAGNRRCHLCTARSRRPRDTPPGIRLRAMHALFLRISHISVPVFAFVLVEEDQVPVIPTRSPAIV